MIFLAVLLLALVAAAVLFVAVTGSTSTVDLVWETAGVAWAPTALAVFLLGAAVMLLAEAAVGLLLRGGRRTGQRRKELERLRRLEARQASTGPTAATAAPAAPAPSSGPVGAHATPAAGTHAVERAHGEALGRTARRTGRRAAR